MHVNNVHHVTTITQVGKELGDHGERLRDIAIEMYRGRLDLGLWRPAKMVFRRSPTLASENLIELVRFYKENPSWVTDGMIQPACGLRRRYTAPWSVTYVGCCAAAARPGPTLDLGEVPPHQSKDALTETKAAPPMCGVEGSGVL